MNPMRRLILMRHAKSDWSHAGLNDHDRPLNPRGTRAAAEIGKWMRARGYLPEQVYCSSATRTRQTLAGLGLEGTPVDVLRSLYMADAEEKMRVLRGAKGQTVLMVGHNPGTCEFGHRLVDMPPNHARFDDFPTCATLVCNFEIDDWNEIGWHHGQPIEFVVPRDLA
jgi:phosphohistidine phosphatase